MVTSNASPLPPEKKHLQCLFGLFSKGTGHRDVPGRGHIPTLRRPRDRKAARGRVGASVLFFFSFFFLPFVSAHRPLRRRSRRFTFLGRAKSVSLTRTRRIRRRASRDCNASSGECASSSFISSQPTEPYPPASIPYFPTQIMKTSF